ncbi:hypothetical protein GOC59_18880 [Sinorhizobium medicae]|nr:hypothetical protein [Sinorhizobium medicae]
MKLPTWLWFVFLSVAAAVGYLELFDDKTLLLLMIFGVAVYFGTKIDDLQREIDDLKERVADADRG